MHPEPGHRKYVDEAKEGAVKPLFMSEFGVFNAYAATLVAYRGQPGDLSCSVHPNTHTHTNVDNNNINYHAATSLAYLHCTQTYVCRTETVLLNV